MIPEDVRCRLDSWHGGAPTRGGAAFTIACDGTRHSAIVTGGMLVPDSHDPDELAVLFALGDRDTGCGLALRAWSAVVEDRARSGKVVRRGRRWAEGAERLFLQTPVERDEHVRTKSEAFDQLLQHHVDISTAKAAEPARGPLRVARRAYYRWDVRQTAARLGKGHGHHTPDQVTDDVIVGAVVVCARLLDDDGWNTLRHAVFA